MDVLVTGGNGFLGRHLIEELKANGHRAVEYSRHDLDEGSGGLFRELQAGHDAVVHCAAVVGGIGLNQSAPAHLFVENMRMGLNVLDACVQHPAPVKLVMIGTTCSYPAFDRRGKYAPFVGFHETEMWSGYPEPTNAAYGVAKRALITAANAYREQFGLKVVTVVPANLYGPGDHFLDMETNHVIPALIRKIYDAVKADQGVVELWGDGSPTRDFLYVKDCARGIRLALEGYDGEMPLNLGTGKETSIAVVASHIAGLMEYPIDFRWDTSKPNGQKRRMLDTQRAKDLISFEAATSFEDGIRETVEWFKTKWSVQ